VALPTLSRHVAQGDSTALRRTLAQSLELIALLCLPAAVGLGVLGVPVIGLIYEHGRFGAADTVAAADALAAYAVGLAGYAGIKVLAPAFYALDDAATPMRVSLVSIVVNLALNWILVRRLGLGHVGLALSTSAVALGNCFMLYALLRRRVGALGDGLARTVTRLVAAAAVMGVAAAGLDAALRPHLPAGRLLHYGTELAVGMPAAAAVFVVTALALGVRLPARLRLRWIRR
jgi:putative peptidoglycan lipid II flippase